MTLPRDVRPAIFTIGHSTRGLGELLALLRSHGVRLLVDVRTAPRSRRYPHFSRERLAESLAEADIRYLHMSELGGLRRPRPDSPNAGWRNLSFRAFADYMQTPAFADALSRLIQMAQREQTAIVCAEALPWRCHRFLISDALTLQGVRLTHILGPARAQVHHITAWARVEGGRITYPPPQDSPQGRCLTPFRLL